MLRLRTTVLAFFSLGVLKPALAQHTFGTASSPTRPTVDLTFVLEQEGTEYHSQLCPFKVSVPDSIAAVSDGTVVWKGKRVKPDTLWYTPIGVMCEGRVPGEPGIYLGLAREGVVRAYAVDGFVNPGYAPQDVVLTRKQSLFYLLSARGMFERIMWVESTPSMPTHLVGAVTYQAKLDSLQRAEAAANERAWAIAESRAIENLRAQRIAMLSGLGASPQQRAAVLSGKVMLGMTTGMVRAAWGEPAHVAVAQTYNGTGAVWYYSGSRSVTFFNGVARAATE